MKTTCIVYKYLLCGTDENTCKNQCRLCVYQWLRVTWVFFIPRAWGHAWSRVMFRCPTTQWMSIEKVGFMFLLCCRKQWESNIVLISLGSRSVLSTLDLPTPHPNMLNTAPELTRVESIRCLGLAERLQPLRAAQPEDKGQSRHLRLSGRELESCFILLDF